MSRLSDATAVYGGNLQATAIYAGSELAFSASGGGPDPYVDSEAFPSMTDYLDSRAFAALAGGAATNWAGEHGGITLTAPGGSQPTVVKAATPTGRDALSFTGGQYLAKNDLAVTGSEGLALVYKATAGVTNGIVMRRGSSADGTTIRLDSSDRVQVVRGAAKAYRSPDTNWHVLLIDYDHTTGKAWLSEDGKPWMYAGHDNVTLGAPLLYLGSQFGSFATTMQAAAVLHAASRLTREQFRDLYTYLDTIFIGTGGVVPPWPTVTSSVFTSMSYYVDGLGLVGEGDGFNDVIIDNQVTYIDSPLPTGGQAARLGTESQGGYLAVRPYTLPSPLSMTVEWVATRVPNGQVFFLQYEDLDKNFIDWIELEATPSDCTLTFDGQTQTGAAIPANPTLRLEIDTSVGTCVLRVNGTVWATVDRGGEVAVPVANNGYWHQWSGEADADTGNLVVIDNLAVNWTTP